MKRITVILVSLLVLASLIIGCAKPSAPASTQPGQSATPVTKELKIGIIGPMKFALGTQEWNAAVLTSEMINEAGGIKVGNDIYMIKVVQYDTNEFKSLDDAVNTFERAVSMDKCSFIIGGVRSEAVVAMQEVMADHKIIYIDPCSGALKQVQRVRDNYDRYKYYFRPGFSASIIGIGYTIADTEASAKQIQKQLGIDKIKAAIVTEKSLFLEEWTKIVADALPKMGMDVVGVWRPDSNATDLFAEVTAIAALKPHIIYCNFSAGGGTAFVTAYGKLQVPALCTGTNSEYQRLASWKESGGACNYITGYDTLARVKMSDTTIPFYDRHIKEFGERTGYPSSHMQASLAALKQAIERAQTLDTEKLIPALEQTDCPVVNGRLTFYPRDSKIPDQPPHLGTIGPGLRTYVSNQWVDGQLYAYYPNGTPWNQVLIDMGCPPGWEKVKYEGTADLKLPPWMISYWKK